MSSEANYKIEAVDCAIDVLSAISLEPDLGASEIARKVGGSRQRIFRMLKTLESRGMIERTGHGKSYRLGLHALVIGNAARNQMDLVRLSEPMLREVGLKTEETIQMRIRQGWETICVARWEPERDIRVHAVIGRRRPLHAGSSKIFLAYMPKAQREQYLTQNLSRFTANTLTDVQTLRARLDEIRSKGYSVSRGEVSDDLISITAPVFTADKSVLAAFNIAAPSSRIDEVKLGRCISIVVDASIKLSRALGYPLTEKDF
ncbi:IclR family transcriptional regulator [Brucellaceae bacterium D45D]